MLKTRDEQDHGGTRFMRCAAIRRSSHEQPGQGGVARVPGPWVGCDWRAGEQGDLARGRECGERWGREGRAGGSCTRPGPSELFTRRRPMFAFDTAYCQLLFFLLKIFEIGEIPKPP